MSDEPDLIRLNSLSEAARLTFVDWNLKAKGGIAELTLPVQEDEE